MGLRFRRSVKICKGLRVNFNKNSWGISVGSRGYGYSFNSKGRRTKHIGIPGTGLSYVTSTSTKKNYNKPKPTYVRTRINLTMDDDGKMTFYNANGTVITDQSLINKIKRTPEYRAEKDRMQMEHNKEMLEKVIEYNRNNNELININKMCAEKIYSEDEYINELKNLKPMIYEKKTFDVPMPTEETVKRDLLKLAKKEIKSIAFWTLKPKWNEYIERHFKEVYDKRYNYWVKEREEFYSNEQKLEKENNEKYEEEFNNNKKYLENIIAGDEECICNDIELWFGELEMPLECNINFEYVADKNILLLDLDLPEIEDFPNQKAIQLASGNMKLQKKTQAELYSDYKNYVFGLALFMVGHIFNISPKIKYITLSAYTQRRARTGEIADDYVYSIKFNRDGISQYDLKTVDSYNVCMSFENRCNIAANNMLKTIQPYSNE